MFLNFINNYLQANPKRLKCLITLFKCVTKNNLQCNLVRTQCFGILSKAEINYNQISYKRIQNT